MLRSSSLVPRWTKETPFSASLLVNGAVPNGAIARISLVKPYTAKDKDLESKSQHAAYDRFQSIKNSFICCRTLIE